MKKFEKYYSYLAAFIFFAALIIVYKTVDNFDGVTKYIGIVIDALKPFFIAFIIAYILNMPAKSLQNLIKKSEKAFFRRRAMGISILVIYVLAIAAVLAVLRMLIPALYKNFVDLYNNLPAYISGLEEYLNSFELVRRISPFGENGFDLYGQLLKVISSINISQFGKYAQGVFNMTSGLFDIFVAVIASIYMLIDKDRLQRSAVHIMEIFLKKERVRIITRHAKRINDIFTNYIYSRLICCTIMAVVCSIALMVMNIKYALILGLFIGLMDMIPYFGSIISFALSVIVAFITGGVWKGVWSGIVLLILQQIDGNLLGPRIMGNSLEIRPLWIIFAVSVGGTLFGFLGMLFSVPVLAIIRAILSDYFEERELRKQTAPAEENVKDE